MVVTDQEKIETAAESIEELIIKLVNEHGNTPEYWLKLLQRTKLYKNLLNPKTGLWGEGVMYLYNELTKEVKDENNK